MAEGTTPALRFAPARVEVEELAGGGRLLRSPLPLAPYPRRLGELLERHAETSPERPFLAERASGGGGGGGDDGDGGGWRRLTYAEVFAAVHSLGQALLDRGLSVARPLALLSDNGVDHALLQLAALHAGIPAVPISPAYSLLSQDHARLRYVLDLVTPGLVYADDGDRYARGLEIAAEQPGTLLATSSAPPAATAETVATLRTTRPGAEIAAAFAGVGPDTVAKILFTSGSTGIPKGVVNTHRMLCSNQQAIAQLWPFLAERPPVVVDWLPWNHTFGGNHNFNLILFHGGTLYIDGGKPAPGLIATTVANLSEISPTLYFNVPRGFDMLIPYLEADSELRDRFFHRLDLIFYAAAALPQNLWRRLEDLALAARGRRVTMVSAWGTTETSPLATSVHFPIERAGIIGLPAPGTEIKLVPVGDKLEIRVRGPNVTPGYWQRDDLTREAFDREGFFRTGDAGRLADPADPARGLVFDGRTAENFKLTSGSWVPVGEIRVAVIAAAEPVIQDAVVTGHDRDALGLLVFPSLAGCRTLCPDAPMDSELSELVRRPEVRQRLVAGLGAYNRACRQASSRAITRVLFLTEPPSIDANEITDKGYVNQRAVLERRAALVERLYGGLGEDVLILAPESV